MYDEAQGALKSAAANSIARGAAIGSSIGGQVSAGLNQARQPVVAEAMLADLHILVDKARSIEHRQEMLRDRIFGSRPQEAGHIGKDVSPNGFLDAVQRQTTELHYIFERITSTLNELERVA